MLSFVLTRSGCHLTIIALTNWINSPCTDCQMDFCQWEVYELNRKGAYFFGERRKHKHL